MRLLLVLILAGYSFGVAHAADGLEKRAVNEIKRMDWKEYLEKLKETDFATLSHEQATAAVAKAGEIAANPDTTITTLRELQATLKTKVAGLNTALTDATGTDDKRAYRAAIKALSEMNTALAKVVTDTKTLNDKLKGIKDEDWKSGAALTFDLGQTALDNARTDEMIKALAARLDSTVVGQYMRTKLEGFSASKEFCASVKNCTDGSAKPKKPIEMKGLFKGDGTHDGTQPAPK